MRLLSVRLAWLFLPLCFLSPASAFADWDYDAYIFSGNWSVLPNFDTLTPVASGTVSTISVAPRTQNDRFALRFRAQVTVDIAGNYTFATNSDDGSQLLIDGTVVIDNDGLHGPRTISSTYFLAAGTYDVEVTMFEQTGGQVLEAWYAPPGGGLRAIPGGGTLAGPPDLSQTGSWGPVIPWTFVPVSAANLPDGRVITWASNERYSFPGGRPEFTYTGIWDPTDNSILEIDHPSHDMFCAHQVMLENGQVFVSGGRNSGNSPWTSVFDINTNQWVPLNNMNRGRWYPTSLALGDGTVFTAIGSGGGNTGEVYDPNTGSWSLLSGIDFNPVILDYPSNQYGERNWWPLFGLMPDGRVFHAGPTPQMHIIDTTGVGTAQQTGAEFTDWYPKHGTTVMYDEGKMITAGGWVSGNSIASTNEAHIIDLNGPAPTVTATNPMIYPRKFHNGVMLPNGEVLVVGGNTSGQKFNDTGTIYPVEIWDPLSQNWREGAAMAVPRNYHSIALLLTDGTVLSAGGGLCNCSADHPNGQIYYPPYLFNSDGSPAARPSILTAPSAIRAGDAFEVTTDEDIVHFSAIKMSSTTHAVNTDLRYLPFSFTGSAGTYELTAHSNPNVLTPGYWMLFALNANGTPSVSKVVQVRAANDSDPDPITTADFDFLSFADTGAFQLNGSAMGTGGVARLTPSSANLAGSLFYRMPIALESTTAFSTSFTFSSSGVSDGAEGLAFIVQGNESTTLGEGNSGLGYRFVPNSLVVEFDTANNASGDPNGNHIAVHTGGDSETPIAFTNAPFDLEDGAIHRAWIEYSSATDSLNIYVSANPSAPRPSVPDLVVGSLDLVSTVGSLGYVGFSAATGNNTNNHDIHAWSMIITTGTTPLIIDPMIAAPQPSDGPVFFSASASGVGLEYSWSFGDGTPQTAYSASADVISHDYAAPGRYVVTLLVRDAFGNVQTVQFIQAVFPPLTAQQPVSSTTILAESLTGVERVWNVNPDNDTVTVINGEMGAKIDEISVGKDPRSLTLAPDGTIWVANKDDATITIIDVNSGNVVGQRVLPPGSRPHGIVAHESSGYIYVTLEQLGVVRKLSMTDPGFWADAGIGPNPRHLSVTGDETRLYVSRFITPPLPDEHTDQPKMTTDGTTPAGGEVLAIDPSTMTMLSTIVLQYSDRQPAEITGPGFPNYLGPAIVAPGGQTAWVPSKQDDILRGSMRNGTPLNHDHTVRAVTSVIDLATETENFGFRVDHDNSSTAKNGAFDRNGVFLFVALEGNRQVVVVDAFAYQEVLRFDVEFAPQGVATSIDGTRVYVHNFMSRSVSIVDTSDLMNGVSETVSVMTNVNTTSGERLSPQVLLGKQLFYDARDPRLSLESYMSCASCHNDGGHDGRVWDLSSLGEGLRNTISLKGKRAMAHGPLHWSANFDEIQDFENQIRDLAGGQGLMSESDYAETQPLLGTPKAGRSADLDALAAYVASLSAIEESPHRNTDGSLTADGLAGKDLFDSTGCAGCHSGSRLSDSVAGVRHDIGTISATSGSRMGATEDPIVAIDTPTLHGLWASAPYLHDGSAVTIEDAVLRHDSAALSGATFTQTELDSLASYLRQIDSREFPPSPVIWQSQDIGAVAAAGSFSESGGTLTVEASGADIWNNADEFHFVYQALTGDGEIVARVASLQVTHQYAKAGVMMRTSLTADSTYAMMELTGSRGAFFQYRQTTGGISRSSGGGDLGAVAPHWVRVVREGDTLTGYKSADGVTWVQHSQVTIAMPTTIYAGLALTSHNDGVINTSTFNNAAVVPEVPPAPDVTPPSVPANVTASATGTTTVSVSWDASTDAESGVGGYQVFRDGLFLASISGTSFDDSGLSPSTSYSYTVLAYDTAVPANLSAQSAAAPVTTDAEVFVVVPDVFDVEQSIAEATINTAGLTVGTVTSADSDTVAAGNVISQSPLSGTSVLEGSLVDLVISLGAAPVTIPDVTGQNVTTATTNLNNASLVVGTVTRTYSDTVPLDAVISQAPDAGLLVANGSAIDLVVSDGPPPPDVTPPSVPLGLSATVAGAYQVNLSWSASSDSESGVGGYRVFRDGLSIGTTAGTAFQATGLAPNTNYTFSVAAFDNATPANESAQSNPVNATTDIEPVWQSQDIGAVAAAGSFSESGGTLTVQASGADIWNNADEFHFVYQTLTGDGEIVARVASLQVTHQWTKAGVMMRTSLTADSTYAMMELTGSHGAYFQYRQTTGGSSASSGGGDPGAVAPHWVRVVREGDTLTGYKSADGVTWVQHSQVTIAMPTTIYAGLALTSHDDGVINTSTFDNAAVVPEVPPAPDVTPPSVPANVTASATGTTTVSVSWDASTDAESGVGGYQVFRDGLFLASISGTSFDDSGLSPSTSYSYTVLAYDTAVPANLSAQSAAAPVTTDAEVFVVVPDVFDVEQSIAEATINTAGLTVGTVTSADSDTVAAGNVISQSPLSGTSVLEGSLVDLVISLGAAPVTIPDVTGQNVTTATTNLNNASLVVGTVTRTYSDTVPLDAVISQAPDAGLLVANGSAIDLVVSDGPTPPSAWANQDIGAVAAAGSFSESGGTLTVEASGADIWNNADEFHFVYQALTGDGEIVARVASLQVTHQYAKAGVMMRTSLTADSTYAMMELTGSRGAFFQYRQTTGGISRSSGGGDLGAVAPHWVRVVREGDTLTGYKSADGVTWVQHSQVTIAMPTTIYAGLALTSHDDGVINTTVFDSVSLDPVGD